MPKRPYVKLTQKQLARKAVVREANRESADTGRGVDDILEEWGEPPRGRKWDLIRSGYYDNDNLTGRRWACRHLEAK